MQLISLYFVLSRAVEGEEGTGNVLDMEIGIKMPLIFSFFKPKMRYISGLLP